jgi:hypothetical protein
MLKMWSTAASLLNGTLFIVEASLLFIEISSLKNPFYSISYTTKQISNAVNSNCTTIFTTISTMAVRSSKMKLVNSCERIIPSTEPMTVVPPGANIPTPTFRRQVVLNFPRNFPLPY